jgi:hypothetical protein
MFLTFFEKVHFLRISIYCKFFKNFEFFHYASASFINMLLRIRLRIAFQRGRLDSGFLVCFHLLCAVDFDFLDFSLPVVAQKIS